MNNTAMFDSLMTPTQAQLVRVSFAKIEPQSSTAARRFYERLFALDPSLRALFRNDLEQQGEKLMQALRFAVAALDRPRELRPVLESLGRRHLHYGVQNRHYDTVGAALIDTLGFLLAPAFTPELKEAWVALHQYVADTMRRGAAQPAPRTG